MDTLVDESVPRLNRPQWPNVLGALGGGVFAIGALLLVTAPGLGLAALGYVSAALGAAMLAVAWIGQHEFAPAIGWIAVVAAFVITYGSLHAFAWSSR